MAVSTCSQSGWMVLIAYHKHDPWWWMIRNLGKQDQDQDHTKVMTGAGKPITLVIPPMIHPTSSCSWGWRWVVSLSLSWWASQLQSSPLCGPGPGPAYPNSLSFITMGHACGRQLAPSTHSVSRCSQPWRRARSCSAIVGGSPSMSLLARSTAIHSASSGLQGWSQVLCCPSAGLNQDVFPVSWGLAEACWCILCRYPLPQPTGLLVSICIPLTLLLWQVRAGLWDHHWAWVVS